MARESPPMTLPGCDTCLAIHQYLFGTEFLGWQNVLPAVMLGWVVRIWNA
jgi:hypothetical protein